MNRRAFLKRFGQAVGIAAVAPVVIPKLLESIPAPASGRAVWVLDWQDIHVGKQVRSNTIDIFTDRETAAQLKIAMARWYSDPARLDASRKLNARLEWKAQYRQQRINWRLAA